MRLVRPHGLGGGVTPLHPAWMDATKTMQVWDFHDSSHLCACKRAASALVQKCAGDWQYLQQHNTRSAIPEEATRVQFYKVLTHICTSVKA